MAKAAKAKTKTTTSTKKAAKKPSSTAKRVTTKRTKAASTGAPSQQFFEFRITEQTLYWLIFGAVAIGFTIWLFTLDAKVRDLYDQIDANTNAANTMIVPRDA